MGIAGASITRLAPKIKGIPYARMSHTRSYLLVSGFYAASIMFEINFAVKGILAQTSF